MRVRFHIATGATIVLIVATLGIAGCSSDSASSEPTSDNSEAPIEQASSILTGPALYQFYTDWCPGCQAMDPVIDAIELDYSGEIAFERIDVEHDSDGHGLMRQLRQGYVPAFYIVDEDGEIVDQWVGQRTDEQVRAALDELLPEGRSPDEKTVADGDDQGEDAGADEDDGDDVSAADSGNQNRPNRGGDNQGQDRSDRGEDHNDQGEDRNDRGGDRNDRREDRNQDLDVAQRPVWTDDSSGSIGIYPRPPIGRPTVNPTVPLTPPSISPPASPITPPAEQPTVTAPETPPVTPSAAPSFTPDDLDSQGSDVD